MRVAVVRFPGSNCDADTVGAARQAGADAFYVWHRETTLNGADAVIVPGGFAYGDHLRAGAIARFSPVMAAVRKLADAGAPVLGICNGFQVLCEAGMLPGALMRNAGQRFLSRPVTVRIENTDTPFTTAYANGAIFRMPVAHGEGRYVASDAVITDLEREGRVVLRYVDDNPNGSVNEIAGVCNPAGNIVGMMPHPERAADPALGETEGARVFESVLAGIAHSSGGPQ